MGLSAKIPKELEARLAQLYKEPRTKKALEEFIEDQEELRDALKISRRMKKNEEKSYTFDEVVKMLGLEEELKNA
jgi:predicted DNA-binding protein